MKFLTEYSPSEQSALRSEICRDAPDVKIDYYLRVCDGQQVDPFSGLLYLTKRTSQGKDKWSVNASVDGSRLKASRTGQYAGSDEPVYDSEDGPHPKWCKVTVYRAVAGQRYAFTAKCRWEEFKPNAPNDFQWKGKPYHMLAKVTEVQALRKGFPDVVPASGEDEEDTVIVEDGTPENKAAALATAQEKAALAVQWHNAVNAFMALGKTEADLLAKLGLAKKEDITAEHTETLREWYEELNRGQNA